MYASNVFAVFCLIFSYFSIIVLAEFTEEQQELMNNLHNECTGQTGASEESITNARLGNFVDDNKLKCYMKCVFDEIGMVGDDGQLDVDGMIAMLPDELKDITGAVMRKCGTQAGADVCDSIWLTHKCYYAENPKAYFLP